MCTLPLNLWTNVGEKWLVIVSVSRHNLPCLPSPKVQRLPDDDNDNHNDDNQGLLIEDQETNRVELYFS